MAHLFRVDGLVAIITGGGTGIGFMMAQALAQNGAKRIYIVGRREDKLKEACAKLGSNVVSLPGDITNKDALQRMAATVEHESGYINLLVTNAGITGPGLETLKPRAGLADFVSHAWNSPMSDFSAVYETNCTATYYTILAFLKLLDAGNTKSEYHKSQVIATASSASFLRNPRAGFAYCSSKAALVSMIKCFSTFCVPWGIRFNAIAAGLFPSDLSEPLYSAFKISKDKPLTEEGAFARSYQPAERAGGAEDITGIILYLAGKAGTFVNGSVILVDGGKLATMPATY